MKSLDPNFRQASLRNGRANGSCSLSIESSTDCRIAEAAEGPSFPGNTQLKAPACGTSAFHQSVPYQHIATSPWARLGFTRRLLITSTAKKCEPDAGGPATPPIKVSRFEGWRAPTPGGRRGEVSKCPIRTTNTVSPSTKVT